MPDNGNEKCVCCGADTGIPRSAPLKDRKYYIVGSGQLCGNCYFELYIGNAEEESLVSPDDISKLMRMCKQNDNP